MLCCLMDGNRDRYGIATSKERWLAMMMIVLAGFSSVVAIYSDAYALFKKKGVLRPM